MDLQGTVIARGPDGATVDPSAITTRSHPSDAIRRFQPFLSAKSMKEGTVMPRIIGRNLLREPPSANAIPVAVRMRLEQSARALFAMTAHPLPDCQFICTRETIHAPR